jgi:hypothetical protein
MINDPSNAPTNAWESGCRPLRRPRSPAAISIAKTIPAEVHTAARTAAVRPVPAIQQISSVASGIAAPIGNRQLAQHRRQQPSGGQPAARSQLFSG